MSDPAIGHAGAAYGTDKDGVLAVFHNRPVQDEHETKVQGRPVFKSEPYVKIMIPKDRLAVQIERLNDTHKARWPKVWQAFQEKQPGVADGTPIEHFTLLTAVQVATLRSQGIVTVEQLANVADSKLSMQLPRDLRERARQFLQGDNATVKELRAENVELRGQVDSLQAQLDQLRAAVARAGIEAADEPAPVKRRGRPRKKASNGTEARA